MRKCEKVWNSVLYQHFLLTAFKSIFFETLNCVVNDWLFTIQENLKLVQIESICRRQNKFEWNIKTCFGKNRKNCGKRRRCWLPAFSPFPTMFSEYFSFRVVIGLECVMKIPSFPKRQILDYSNLKVFADDKFKFHEIGRKFSKSVENTVGKGEIARYEQFLLFPLCFQKTFFADTWKPGLVWERVKVSCSHFRCEEGMETEEVSSPNVNRKGKWPLTYCRSLMAFWHLIV